MFTGTLYRKLGAYLLFSLIINKSFTQNTVSGLLTLGTSANSVITMGGDNTVTASGTFNFNNQNSRVIISGASFTNNGTVNADSGRLDFNSTSAQTSAGIYTVGSLFSGNTSASGVTFGNPASNNNVYIVSVLGFTATNGKINAQEGGITLRSTPAKTARIANQLKSGGNGAAISNTLIDGKITVERYIDGTAFRKWHLLSPTVNGVSIRNSWQEGGTQNASYGTYITNPTVNNTKSGNNHASGYDPIPTDAVNPSASIRKIAANGVMTTPSSTKTTNLETADAWFIFVRSARPTNLATSGYTSNLAGTTTLRATGTINQNTTFNTVIGNGTACVPVKNPFASPIDLKSMNIPGGKIYVWDPTYGGTVGGYRYYEADMNGDYKTFSAGGDFPQTMNVLQSGQSFLVPQGTSGTISIGENNKAETALSNVLRNTSSSEPFIRTSILSTEPASGNLKERDMTVALFKDNASNNFVNGEDVQKLGNFNENISLMRGGQYITVEKMQQPTLNDTLKLQTWKMEKKAYTLEIETSGLTNNLQPYLVDKYLQIETPLVSEGIMTYDFVSNEQNSNYADLSRFTIVFKQNTALPVTFKAIKAYKKSSGVNVEWAVGEEKEIANYEVERSANGNEFTTIATVAAKNVGNTTYTQFDAQPLNGDNFYRVKSIDKAGAVKYTSIVKVNLNNTKEGTISVYPNPVRDSRVNLNMSDIEKGNYNLVIYSIDGKQIISKAISFNGGTANEVITLPNGTAKGVYQLQLNGDKTYGYKVVVE